MHVNVKRQLLQLYCKCNHSISCHSAVGIVEVQYSAHCGNGLYHSSCHCGGGCHFGEVVIVGVVIVLVVIVVGVAGVVVTHGNGGHCTGRHCGHSGIVFVLAVVGVVVLVMVMVFKDSSCDNSGCDDPGGSQSSSSLMN